MMISTVRSRFEASLVALVVGHNILDANLSMKVTRSSMAIFAFPARFE